jgi:tyrosyl-tRNA synthetase
MSVIERNAIDLQKCIKKFFSGATVYAEARLQPTHEKLFPIVVRSNIEWFGNMNLLDFLRRTGAFTRINPMLNRER